MGTHESLEHGEHVEEAAHSGKTQAALLIAILAAVLALSEQRGKHAEIRVEESAIGATDAWAQYQAKSVRATISRDLADVMEALHVSGGAPADDRVALVTKRLADDSVRYEHGEGGKDDIAKKAKRLEEERDRAVAETHAYDNAVAALELGIVLATASAITNARPLLIMAVLLGLAGIVFDVLGALAPEYGAM